MPPPENEDAPKRWEGSEALERVSDAAGQDLQRLSQAALGCPSNTPLRALRARWRIKLNYCIYYIHIHPISIKLGPKILQVGIENPPSWLLKSYKISPRRCLGGVLGPSWPQEAPKRQQDTTKERNGDRVGPPPPADRVAPLAGAQNRS